MTALIRCEDVSFAYDGVTIVKGLNFTVSKGDYLCVVGENGSGKSTLVKGILRQKQPRAGRLTLSGGLLEGGIGYLPQQKDAHGDFPASVLEAVMSGRIGQMGGRPFFGGKDRAAAYEALKRLDAYDLRDRSFRELSGGQRQRALLARALCAARDMLLLDEPVTGLDPLSAREMYSIIHSLNRDSGMTIVMVTHDVAAALKNAVHILHLGGDRHFFGSASEYVRSAASGGFFDAVGGVE